MRINRFCRTALLLVASAFAPAAHAQYTLAFTSAENDRVTVQTPTPVGAYTMEAWVRNTGNAWLGSYNTILEWGNDEGYLGVDASGQPLIYNVAVGPTALTLGQWHHLAYVWDGFVYGYLYLDGQLTAFTSSSGIGTPQTELGIGYHVGDRGWQGQIDEVMLWDASRTLPQIQADAMGTTLPSTPGLRMWLRFNEGAGQNVSSFAGPNTLAVLGGTNAVEPTDPAWQSGTPLAAAPDLVAAPQALEALYPNPATPATAVTVRFALLTSAPVTLEVLDALGRPVCKLLRDEVRPAGPQSVLLPTERLAAGLYTCQLTLADGQVSRRRLVVAQ